MKVTLNYYCIVDEYGRLATSNKGSGHCLCPVSKLDEPSPYKNTVDLFLTEEPSRIDSNEIKKVYEADWNNFSLMKYLTEADYTILEMSNNYTNKNILIPVKKVCDFNIEDYYSIKENELLLVRKSDIDNIK